MIYKQSFYEHIAHYIENKQQDHAEPQIQMQQHFKQDFNICFPVYTVLSWRCLGEGHIISPRQM